MAARVRINSRGIKEIEAPGGDVDRAVRRAAETAADRARGYIRSARYGPGDAIADSIGVRRSGTTATGRVRFTVSAKHDLAKIYEKGSKPHTIKPVKASALHFKWGRVKVVVPHKAHAGAWYRNPPKGLKVKTNYPSGDWRGPYDSLKDTWAKAGVLISFKGYVDHPGTKKIGFMEQALRSIRKRDFLP